MATARSNSRPAPKVSFETIADADHGDERPSASAIARRGGERDGGWRGSVVIGWDVTDRRLAPGVAQCRRLATPGVTAADAPDTVRRCCGPA